MILILDTETIGDFSKPEIYDLGYVIADADGNIVKERSYTIKEIFCDADKFASAYFKDKRPLYERRLETGYSSLVYLNYALYMLLKDIERYGINDADVYAYNSGFDLRAIKTSADKYGRNKYKLDTITDIYKGGFATTYITNDADYIAFCEKYGFMTKRNKPKASAEVVYKYLTHDADYEEEHTALEDSKIEKDILMECLRRRALALV